MTTQKKENQKMSQKFWDALSAPTGVGVLGDANAVRKLLGTMDAKQKNAFTLDGKMSAVHHAVRFKNVELLKVLIADKDVLLDQERDTGDTPLLAAMREASSDEAIAMLLLNAGRDVGLGISDKGNNTPLHMATKAEYLPVIEKILQSNEVDFTQVNKEGKTALHLSMDCWPQKATQLVTLLLHNTKIAQDINHQTLKEQDAALHLAARFGKDALVAKLMEHHASAAIPNKAGFLPSETATNNNRPAIAETIREYADTEIAAQIAKLSTLFTNDQKFAEIQAELGLPDANGHYEKMAFIAASDDIREAFSTHECTEPGVKDFADMYHIDCKSDTQPDYSEL